MSLRPSSPAKAADDGIWHGTIVEINGDELTCDLRRDGCQDVLAEVSASEHHLEDVQVGDVLELDTVRQTVTRLDFGTWTQEEVDVILARAKERYERIMRCVE
jgi:hypothetical protein